MQLLLGRNPPAAYIDSRDSMGRTALHFCVSSEAEGNEAGKAHEGAAACVSALLGAGADWRVRDAADLHRGDRGGGGDGHREPIGDAVDVIRVGEVVENDRDACARR